MDGSFCRLSGILKVTFDLAATAGISTAYSFDESPSRSVITLLVRNDTILKRVLSRKHRHRDMVVSTKTKAPHGVANPMSRDRLLVKHGGLPMRYVWRDIAFAGQTSRDRTLLSVD